MVTRNKEKKEELSPRYTAQEVVEFFATFIVACMEHIQLTLPRNDHIDAMNKSLSTIQSQIIFCISIHSYESEHRKYAIFASDA